MEEFKKELTELINIHSIENVVDMPDFLLAEMICRMILEIKSAEQEAEDSARMLAVCAVIISLLGMLAVLVWATVANGQEIRIAPLNLDKICSEVRIDNDGKLYCAKAVDPPEKQADKAMRDYSAWRNRKSAIESNRDDYRFRHLLAFPIYR